MRRRKTVLGMAALVLALAGCTADDDTPDAAVAPSSAGSSASGPLPPGSSAAGPSASAVPGGSAGPAASAVPEVPSASATAGLGGAPPAATGGTLGGKRQIFLLPRLDDTELPDSVLAVTEGGRLQVTDNFDESALFVPVPPGQGAKTHLIKTGVLRAGRAALCLRVRANGADPLTVVTAACDAKDPLQHFIFETSGEDDQGRPTYAVRNRDAFLQWHPLGGIGLVAEELGDSQLETTFAMQDQGAAALPR